MQKGRVYVGLNWIPRLECQIIVGSDRGRVSPEKVLMMSVDHEMPDFNSW
jgi:hypothetical protein